jgi:hypothetical protein
MSPFVFIILSRIDLHSNDRLGAKAALHFQSRNYRYALEAANFLLTATACLLGIDLNLTRISL